MGSRGCSEGPGRPALRYSERALARIVDLRRHYRQKGRPEPVRNFTAALRQAARQIAAGEDLPAPRPYPELATPGEAWTHAGRYWVAYTTTTPPVILAVFYDQADIPGRF